MPRNYEKILFDFINKIGPGFLENFCIIDNTGKLAGTSKHYRVFMKGGISFDISHEPGGGETEYDFIPEWEGPFETKTAEGVLGLLTVMGHSFTKELKAQDAVV